MESFDAFIKVMSGSNRRLSILVIRGTFISSQFIDKHKLVDHIINKLSYSDVLEFLVPLSGALLCLLIGLAYIKKIDHDDVSFCYLRDMYLLFVPPLLLKKALDRLG